MQQRFLYIWFPRLATDRNNPQNDTSPEKEQQAHQLPFAVTRSDHLGVFLTGCNEAARRLGLHPAMRLADARALFPDLATESADPEADLHLLKDMVRFAERFSPWIAIDGPDQTSGEGGLWLDMSGGAHLFGGERALMDKVDQSFQRFGCALRLGFADTPAAAWAAARHHPENGLLNSGETRQCVEPFPLDALRLPLETVQVLNRLGFRRIADLYPIPRANMTTRFGPDVMLRLDQLLGRHPEHLAFEQGPRIYEVRQHWPEPLGAADIITHAVELLLDKLCQSLRQDDNGLRSLGLWFQRVDNTTASLIIATSAPSHDATHLMRLLHDRLPGVDAGFGIETIRIRAFQTQRLSTEQGSLIDSGDLGDTGTSDLTARHKLVDRLAERLGTHSVYRFAQRQSHLPERVPLRLTVSGSGSQQKKDSMPSSTPSRPIPSPPIPSPPGPSRPVRLLTPAEDVEVLSFEKGIPKDLRWRRLTLHAQLVQGPERIMREWWRDLRVNPWDYKPGRRDYYRFDDQLGRSLWLCRISDKRKQHRWFVQGWFAEPPS
jgi:protein ImuB